MHWLTLIQQTILYFEYHDTIIKNRLANIDELKGMIPELSMTECGHPEVRMPGEGVLPNEQ